MPAAEGAAAGRERGSAGAASNAAEATPATGVDPASLISQVAAGSSPLKAGDADKASAVAGLLERWPGSAAALLAQTMGCPDVSKDSNSQAGRVSMPGPLHGGAPTDLGVSPSMLNFLQTGAFMHAPPPSLLSAPQGQAAAALISQGCTPNTLTAADTANIPAHLSRFPGSGFWGVSALGGVSATSPPFLTNAAAASLLTAANVDSTGLGCCFPEKLPLAPAREQPQRVRLPQTRQQQQQQPLLPTQQLQHPAACSTQDQQLLSISPLLMMMPPAGSASDPSAAAGRVVGGAAEEPQPSAATVPGATAAISREALPKVVGVRYDKVNKTWRASWYDPQSKRRVERKFSVNKLGFINAYNLATECRKLQEKKLGLRDRSGRKQNQQQPESQAASATMQQPSSPTARAALTAATFPRFDLHSGSAAAAAWEATASTVSPPMDLSLLGPSLKAFRTSNTSTSSSRSSLPMPGAQTATLLPMESLLSMTDQHHQHQLQQQHQLQEQRQLQPQQLRQQTCLQQPLGETPAEGQQLQHLGACSDRSSATTRGPADSSYLAQSIANVGETERRAEKGVPSTAALGGGTVLSVPLSVLSPQLFDLGASRQQQQQQPSGDVYGVHEAAALRRSFHAFEVGSPFIPNSSSGQQLLHRNSHHDNSSRPVHTFYYSADGHTTVKTPAESPSTPQANAVASEGATCATPLRGGGEKTIGLPGNECKGIPGGNHEHREGFAGKVDQDGNLPVKSAPDPCFWEERVSRGEKRRLQPITSEQQRRAAPRLALSSTPSPGSTSQTSDILQQPEKQRHHSQVQQSEEDASQQQANVQSYDTIVSNTTSDACLSVSFGGTTALHTDEARRSIERHEEGCVQDPATCGRQSDSFVADFSPGTAPTSNSVPNIGALAYKLPSRRSDDTVKSRRSSPADSSSYQSACADATRTTPAESSQQAGNWVSPGEKSACRRLGDILADKGACGAAALPKFSGIGGPDGNMQQQHHPGAGGLKLPASEAGEEPANVESLPSPAANSHGRGPSSNEGDSRMSGRQPNNQKGNCTRQFRTGGQHCIAGEQQPGASALNSSNSRMTSDDDAVCGPARQTEGSHYDSQQCVETNDPPVKQQVTCTAGVLRSHDRGSEDVRTRAGGNPPTGSSAGLQQSYAGNTAAPSRRRKHEALLSPASFFVPSSPLGGSPFSLAAYALTAAAGANNAYRGAGRRRSLSSLSTFFQEAHMRYCQRAILPSMCGTAAECSCERACPVLQEAGAGGAAVLTRRRGVWCRCRASCRYKSSAWQSSVRPGWQELSDGETDKQGHPTCGALPIVVRRDAKRFASLRLPKQLPRVQHPSDKKKGGEDEDLCATKWNAAECWLPEGASSCGEEGEDSPSVAFTDWCKALKSTEANAEECNYVDAATGKKAEVLGTVEKKEREGNGSNEVLGLVKELLLLLLQSLQEALTSLCERRIAGDHGERGRDSLTNNGGGGKNDKWDRGWNRRSRNDPVSSRPSPEVADSSSNSTCDSDGAATDTSPSEESSLITAAEALECAAAVERHTQHVRSTGEIDQLTAYTNLFQTCIRFKLVPTELPPLQLLHLLRQLTKTQFPEVNGCKQAINGKKNRENSPCRKQAGASLKGSNGNSLADDGKPSAPLDKATVNARDSPRREDSLGEEPVHVVPKAKASPKDAQRDPAVSSHDVAKARSTTSPPPCTGDGSCRSISYPENSRTERSGGGSKGSTPENTCETASASDADSTCESKTTTSPPQGRCARVKGSLTSIEGTKTTTVSSDSIDNASCGLQASRWENDSRIEKCCEENGSNVSTGESADPPEEGSAGTDFTCEKKMTRNSVSSSTRSQEQPVHEHYTRSRSRGGRSSGGRDRFAEASACEPEVRSVGGDTCEKTRMSGADEVGVDGAGDQQHSSLRSAVAAPSCEMCEPASSSEEGSEPPYSSEMLLAQRSRTECDLTPYSIAESKDTEARLALLAREILDEHEPLRWMPEAPSDAQGVENVMGDLSHSSATHQFEEHHAAMRLLCEEIVANDSGRYAKHYEQDRAPSAGLETLPEEQSPSAAVKVVPTGETRRRPSRRSRSQGSLGARAAPTSPTRHKAAGVDALRGCLGEKDVEKVASEAEDPARAREHPAVHINDNSEHVTEQQEKSQSILTDTKRACRRGRDCRARSGEAQRAEDPKGTNAGKLFRGNSSGVAVRRTGDSLEKLLL